VPRTIRAGSAISLLLLMAAPFAHGQTEAEALSASFRKAARRVLPSVVTVRTFDRTHAAEPEGVASQSRRETGGSGVVIDATRGYVLTNHHVIDGAAEVMVILAGGKERPVKQIRRDPKSDLALLSIDPAGLTAAVWGDSDVLDTGDWVLAIGQPFGLSDTVTAGIVSGKGRGVGLALYEDLIQTDAAINPGNSGGPLVNLKGEVVGINTALKTVGGGYEGVGFAVPASRARRVASDLGEFGVVRRAFVGVNVRRADARLIERQGLPGAVVVTLVAPNSPASDAGLRPGDLLLKLDGTVVDGPGPLQSMVEVAKVGRPMKLTIDRDGRTRDLEIVPRSQPERFGLPEPASRPPG
jgi:serine protease Do